MPSIITPEVASAFGVLDQDAFADGRALDAGLARTLVRQANLLVARRHQFCNLVWPQSYVLVEGLEQYGFEVTSPIGNFGLILPPILKPKKNGLSTGTARLRALLPLNNSIDFRVETSVARGAHQHVMTCAGTGGWEKYSMAIDVAPGPLEEIRLYARGNGRGELMDTATYGTPNSVAVSNANSTLLSTQITVTSGAWATGNTGVSAGGHYAVFSVTSSGQILAERLIADNSGSTITFAELTDPEYLSVVAARWQSDLTLEIRTSPVIRIGQFLVTLNDRSV